MNKPPKDYDTLGQLRYYPETGQVGVAFDHEKMAAFPVEEQLGALDGVIDVLEMYEHFVRKYKKEFFDNPEEIIKKEIEEMVR